MCDALIANVGLKNPSKKVQNVCDDGCIKYGSYFGMRRNKRNGQPDKGVCDIQHTVHSDELFVIRQHKRNGQLQRIGVQLRISPEKIMAEKLVADPSGANTSKSSDYA